MNPPEFVVITINLVVMLIAYFIIYPKFCGSNGNKIAINDAIASVLILLVSGFLYYGTGHVFNMLLFSTNWFWFTLLSYAAIETPLMLWYLKKHNVWESLKP